MKQQGTESLEQLEAERATLALAVEEGTPGAAKELERVEARIAEARRSVDRQAAAQVAREERERAAQVEEAARQRQALIERAADLEKQLVESLAADIDATAAALIEKLNAYTRTAKEHQDTQIALGGNSVTGGMRLIERTQNAAWSILWRLSEADAFGRIVGCPPRPYCKPLVELLGGTSKEQPTSEYDGDDA